MFNDIQYSTDISKDEYKSSINNIIGDLVSLQYKFKDHRGPLIIIISGFYGAGIEKLLNFISHHIDMRLVKVHTSWKKVYNKEKPHLYNYWQALPERGKTAIFLHGWYKKPIKDYVNGKISALEFENHLIDIEKLEKMLAEDGAVFLKFWLFIDKKRMKNVIKKAENIFGNSIENVIKEIKWNYKYYEKFSLASEKAIITTDTSFARWNIINARSKRYLKVNVLKSIHELFSVYKQQENVCINTTLPKHINNSIPPILSNVDLSKTLSKNKYEKKLKELGKNIYEITWKSYYKKVGIILVFEGFDAAGKGGCIRRLTDVIDTRLYNIYQTTAPSDYEKRFHYLWRFWNQVPSKGFITIFDRSWYGRVLVERIENLANYTEWSRAYEEINSFEEQLFHSGIKILKFWLHLSKDEQLRRFKEREELPWKRYKITEEDWRNRSKWEEYEKCANEVFLRTNTSFAPWLIIPSNNKQYARIEVMKNLYNTLRSAI
ncbi:MAG: polyphosphate:AMP phosphotransferase [Deferribacterota bacterium]|nr:polyphosphate:AMP phosphotransferase [Deferribacterota bacterium]